tara:strand:- start:5991 stop:6833 length:843 start_codon:yes stop_codon:yes gene_type:complete
MSLLQTIGTLGSAATSYFGAASAAKKMRQDPSKIAADFEGLSASSPRAVLDKGYDKYLSNALQDPAGDQLRKVAEQNLAGNVNALKAGGAQALLGGLSGVSTGGQDRLAQIEADSFGRQQGAREKYNAASQRVGDANTRFDQNFEASKFSALRGAETYNQQLEGAKSQALGEMGSAVFGLLGNAKKGNTDLSTDFTGGLSFMEAGGLDGDPSTSWKSGGMITPGKFSHETNPIDMLKDGAKIGEMTGGEVILNPEQQEKVAKQSPIFRKLMRKFAMKAQK